RRQDPPPRGGDHLPQAALRRLLEPERRAGPGRARPRRDRRLRRRAGRLQSLRDRGHAGARLPGDRAPRRDAPDRSGSRRAAPRGMGGARRADRRDLPAGNWTELLMVRERVKIADLDELPPGRGKTITALGHELTVVNREGRLVATAAEPTRV